MDEDNDDINICGSAFWWLYELFRWKRTLHENYHDSKHDKPGVDSFT